MPEDHDSVVSKFYENRSIFITGATGFVGKVLLEKLLRSCPDIKHIYILMREKKGKSPGQRLEELMGYDIFHVLKSERPEVLKKVIALAGDMFLPDLGLSESDITEMIQNDVSIVFHQAATVRFNESLTYAVNMNTLGTRRLLELCRKLKNIEALVHVSTAFSNCDRNEIEEVIYPPRLSLQQIIELTKWMEPDMTETVTAKIIGDHPNTYTFTKALAENLLDEEHGSVPVAIVRPSSVCATWKEPFPGWIDSLNGSTGLLAAIAKGMLQTFLCHRELVGDMIPVDVVINVMITVAWHTAVHRPNRTMVYNCTSGSTNKVTWSELLHYSIKYAVKYPSAEVFRYPHVTFTRNRVSKYIYDAYHHYLIPFLVDTVSYIFCSKPRMIRSTYKKMHKTIRDLSFFTTREFKFHCDNILMLKNLLSEEDKKKFFVDVQTLNWESYWKNHVFGFRKYLLKEDPSTIPAARENLKMKLILSQAVQVILFIGMLVVFIFFSNVLFLKQI